MCLRVRNYSSSFHALFLIMDELVEQFISRTVDRPYDIPFNVAVWIAFKPMLKIYLSIGAGFIFAKMNILTPELSKGISRLILVLFLPSLIFNNIVSEIKDTDAQLLGVIVFTGFIYYLIGLGWGFIIRGVSPIPRAWFGGLLLCCMINNCSDLPLAYIQTIGDSPLLPARVAPKGVSYCVLFTIVFTIFTFNLGGTRLVAWDATRVDPKREEPTVPYVSWESAKTVFKKWEKRFNPKSPSKVTKESAGNEMSLSSSESKGKKLGDLEAQEDSAAFSDHEQHVPYNEADHRNYLARTVTGHSIARAQSERPFGSTEVYYARTVESEMANEGFEDARSTFTINSEGPVAFQNMARRLSRTSNSAANNTAAQIDNPSDSESLPADLNKSAQKKQSNTIWQRFKRSWAAMKSKNGVFEYIGNFCEDLFLPQMIALISGIFVAFMPWVRRVFVTGQNIKGFRDAPDHMPPLSFIMEFFSFFAAAQVPLGLMLLGGTIASLKVGKFVPGFWKSLALIVVFKLAILPIIGCAWIHRLRYAQWIDRNDPTVPIVLAAASGTPSATVQIYLTLAWIDPTKESVELNCLALALMFQYAFLPITMTFLMTYVVMHFV